MPVGDVVILPHFFMQVFDLVVNVINFRDETTTIIMKRDFLEMDDLAMQVDFPLEYGVGFGLQQVNQSNLYNRCNLI